MKPTTKPIRQQADYWRAQSPALALGSFLLRDFTLGFSHFFWHHHPEIEIHEVLSGEGVRFVMDATSPFKPGDLCLLGGDLPHCWMLAPGSRKKVRTRVLQFHPGLFGNLLEVNADLRPVAELLQSARGGFQVLGSLRLRVSRRLRGMMEMKPGHPLRLARLLELLSELSEGLKNPRIFKPLSRLPVPGAILHNDPRFAQVVHYLESHASEPMTQKSLSDRIDMKPAAFSRWFRRRTRTTFEKYLTQLRLGKALRLLMETAEPVGHAAVLSGFASTTHFYRVFQKTYGETPNRFRSRMQAVAASSSKRYPETFRRA